MSALAPAAGLTLVAVVAAIVVANALVYASWARAWRQRDTTCELLDDEEPPPWPARALAWSRMFVAECAAGVVAALTAPLDVGGETLRGDGRPVVLVTGWLQHRRQLGALARRLRRDGRAVLVASAPGHDIESRAAALAETVRRIQRDTGTAHVDIVACGSGGLAARACLGTLGRCGGIGHLVTLGTPHGGTLAVAWLGHAGRLGELRPDSAFLRRLAADDAVRPPVECTSIYSVDDAFVVPAEAGYYGGAFNIELRGLGHLSLARSARVYELIRENLGVEPATESRAVSAGDSGRGR